MIGTSTLPFVDIYDYPRINDINSLDSLPDPGYPLAPDPRKGQRLLTTYNETQAKKTLNRSGLTIPDGKYPNYPQI